MNETAQSKKAALSARIESLQSVVVAYSGGVDSSVVAAVAHEVLGDRALVVTAASPSLARGELAAARSQAAKWGWNHRVVRTHELDRSEYVVNGADRCYWCKIELFEVLGPIAHDLGATIVVGTNRDDLGDYRPGHQAAAERSVSAPLLEAGLGKDDVRAIAESIGLPTADKPAAPCLASRIAYGVEVTPPRLRRIDRAEEIVSGLGFTDVRVRDHGDLARIEVSPSEIERAAALRDRLAGELSALGWRYVTVDLAGYRTGSLNAQLNDPVIKRS